MLRGRRSLSALVEREVVGEAILYNSDISLVPLGLAKKDDTLQIGWRSRVGDQEETGGSGRYKKTGR
jgi:hypothetical protein